MSDSIRPQWYPLDNSAILHMIALANGRPNIYRMELTLTEPVQPQILQTAFQRLAPRFPTIVAGIRWGAFQFQVVPAEELPEITPEETAFVPMDEAQIGRCAMRLTYRDNQIAGEFFHSLTDGHGAIVFLTALLAEYLRLLHGITLPGDTDIPLPGQIPSKDETEDSFLTYAGSHMASLNKNRAYQPWANHPKDGTHTVVATFPVAPLLERARQFRVSVTTFLVAVLTESLWELQRMEKEPADFKPVQIMVPANLRKKFPSKTLRNFSLYGITRLDPKQADLPFEALAAQLDAQLKPQFETEQFARFMATNTLVDRNVLLRRIPLKLKCAVLGLGHRFLGERTTSLTMTNLGYFRCPAELQPYVADFNTFVAPRNISAYNCSIMSFGDELHFNFVKTCRETQLERIFLRRMADHGLNAHLTADGVPTEL